MCLRRRTEDPVLERSERLVLSKEPGSSDRHHAHDPMDMAGRVNGFLASTPQPFSFWGSRYCCGPAESHGPAAVF